MLSGEVNMWRSIVVGRITRKATNDDDVADPPDPMPVLQRLERRAVDELAQRVADEAPLLVVGPALEGDAEHLGAEAGEPDGEERAEDQRRARAWS